MTKHLFFILITSFLLTLTHCNNKTNPSDPEAEKQTEDELSAPSYSTPELINANEISGVYTAKADVDYGVDNIWKLNVWGDNSKADVKVSINHSGSDANKQLIVRVEEVSEEAESFCTVWNDLQMNSETNQFIGEPTSAGKIIDAKVVYSVTLTTAEDGLVMPDILIKSDQKGQMTAIVRDLTKIDETVRSFNELYDSCFTEEKTDEQDDDNSGEEDSEKNVNESTSNGENS